MPTYEYKRADGTTFEIFQPITADALVECPTTGQSVERMISGGTGFILKGSGFYQTDYVEKPTAKADKTSTTEDKKIKSDSNGKLSEEKKTVASKKED
ncbi:MAG: zinc ribbon domain-containing protein [Bacteroidetes bacterium]|nr:zinc ribbon domain-containing protein [Bacteroidota bacterium]MCY4205036.1 zinc ribbon domain-containing protein [Bacteroidota bacterium]